MKRSIITCDQCNKEINGQGVIRIDVAAIRQLIDAVEPDRQWSIHPQALAVVKPDRGEVCSVGCLGAWFHERVVKALEPLPATI